MLFDLRETVFDYGDMKETYSSSAHFVPSSRNLWIAGHASAREVLIGRSAMEIIAFLSLHLQRYPQPQDLCVIALGNRAGIGQLQWIREKFKRRKFTLLFENDLTGRATDIVVAAGLRGLPVRLCLSGQCIHMLSKGRNIFFQPAQLSLNAFELAFSFRSGIRTRKSRHYATFLEQLKYDNLK